MMRILFGHQIFDSQTVEGPARYFAELARHLVAAGVAVDIAVRETNAVYLHRDVRWQRQVRTIPASYHWPARLWQLAVLTGVDQYLSTNRPNRRASIAALRAGNFDVFHPTYYEPYFLRYLNGKPFVLTVHDMIHELFPEYVRRVNRTSAWKRRLVEAAAHIIAVSASTKQDLVRLWRVPPERITVVHHGVGHPFIDAGAQPQIAERYLLFVGNRGRYKNFTCFLEALPPLLRAHADLRVVCVGGGGWTVAEQERMHQLGIAQRITQVEASDVELAALYQGATAFVFPSRYEGFGLPILEALASGCPAVVSAASAFPEVAGDAALYFDPREPAELTQALQTLLASPALQARLRTEGRERSRHFTWARTAGETRVVYERVLAR